MTILLKDYTLLPNNSKGVYVIHNKVNNKFYIGSTEDKEGFRKRLRQHYQTLLNNRHYNSYLQKAVNKYGVDNFIVIIEECDKDIRKREQELLDIFSNYSCCYNISKLAGGGDIVSNLSEREKTEWKNKLSKVRESKTKEELLDWYNKISKSTKQALKNLTTEQKAEIEKKRSQTLKNKTPEEKAEWIRKIRQTLDSRTDEEKNKTFLKVSKSRLGKPLSEEHKQNIAKGLLGKPFTKTRKENISKSLKTRDQTEKDLQSFRKRIKLANYIELETMCFYDLKSASTYLGISEYIFKKTYFKIEGTYQWRAKDAK